MKSFALQNFCFILFIFVSTSSLSLNGNLCIVQNVEATLLYSLELIVYISHFHSIIILIGAIMFGLMFAKTFLSQSTKKTTTNYLLGNL
jgi:hypothetical protein